MRFQNLEPTGLDDLEGHSNCRETVLQWEMMHFLEEDLQTFSVKDQIVNILDFADDNYLTLTL